ncbi:MAG: hypothetical protein ACREDI_08640, partial [Roseiarcus sp.]
DRFLKNFLLYQAIDTQAARDQSRQVSDGPLRSSPAIRRAALRHDFRICSVKIVPNYPYEISYRVSEGLIDILHIRHSARRPWIA